MTVAEVLRTLRQRWLIPLAAAVLAAVAAYAYTKLPWVEPRWRSSVLIQATGRLDYGNFLALEKELQPLAEQVRQLGTMREVDQNLHTDLPPELILDHTQAEPVANSDQIRLDVDDSDPHRAEQLSLEIANVYTTDHNAAEQSKLREERVILTTLDRPTQAVKIWPRPLVLVPAAALLGLVAASAVVLLGLYLDTSIRSAADVERYLDLPVVGLIPRSRPVSIALPERPSAQPGASVPPSAALSR